MPKPRIPTWFPPELKPKLEAVIQSPLPDGWPRSRSEAWWRVLGALSSDDSMRVMWEKLLPARPSPEQCDKAWSIFIYALLIHWKAHELASQPIRQFGRDCARIATLARQLADEIGKKKPLLRDMPMHALGISEDPQVTLARIANAYKYMAETHYPSMTRGWPRLRKYGAQHAAETLYMKLLSDRIQAFYRKPYDTVVASVTSAVFKNSVSEDRVRKNRAPIDSRTWKPDQGNVNVHRRIARKRN
jgi:hypothetical protein